MSTQNTQTHTRDETHYDLIERALRAGNARDAESQRKQVYILEILDTGNPDGVTIEQIDAEYDPRIAELDHAYEDAKNALSNFYQVSGVTKDDLIERFQHAGEALNAEIQRKQAYIIETAETGNPDGVTIEQIDAEYDPRITALYNAQRDAMRAVAIFNGYLDEFLDEFPDEA